MSTSNMESEDLRCLDVVAQVSLINMLKVNFSCCPDIYRTLLAVLCDFDPNKPESKRKTSQYIQLLISDKLLANCIIVSLPQGNQERLELEQKTDSLPLKQSILLKECSSSEERTGTWLSQQAQNAKELEISEGPDKSITIIVSGQRGSNDSNDVTEDKTLTIPSAPCPIALYPKELPANHSCKRLNGLKVLDSRPHKGVKMTASKMACTGRDGSPASKIKDKVCIKTSVSSKKPMTEVLTMSVSLSCSSNQLVSATSSKMDSKQKDSLKGIRPKLVLPVHVASHGLVSIPNATNSSQLNIKNGNADFKTSYCQHQIPGEINEPDYQGTLSYKPNSKSTVTTVHQSEGNDCFNPQIQVLRKSSYSADKNVIVGLSGAGNKVAKVCSDARRCASSPLDEEPVHKMRKLSRSADQQVSNSIGDSVSRNSDRLKCFQDMLDNSKSMDLSTTGESSRESMQKASLGYADLLSKLPIQSNQISDSGQENRFKEKNSEIRNYMCSSWQERENATTSLSDSRTTISKLISQHSLLMPVGRGQTTTCTMAKEYYLSYPTKKRINAENSKNSSSAYQGPSQSMIVPSSSDNYACNSNKLPESAKYTNSVCNTICYGPMGPKSFPYRQQIHLSNGCSTDLDFPTDFVVNHPTVSITDRMHVETEQRRMIRDSEKENEPNLDLFRPVAETQVADSVTDIRLTNPRNKPLKKDSHLGRWAEEYQSICSTSSEGTEKASKDCINSAKQTFLIIETKTSNGSDQVQIKLNPQNSGNLLGELLKLKPGFVLKQECIEPNSSDYFAKEVEATVVKNADIKVASGGDTGIDSFLRLDDKSSISDISDEASSYSDEFHCLDDFSDQSDIIPIQLDACPGKPTVVSFPMLNANVFQRNLQQSRDNGEDEIQSLKSTPKPYCQPYNPYINTPMLPVTGSMTAGLTDYVRIDNMNSVPMVGEDNGNQLRISSCGMSPYLMELIPDMKPSTYDENLSLEVNDDVFL